MADYFLYYYKYLMIYLNYSMNYDRFIQSLTDELPPKGITYLPHSGGKRKVTGIKPILLPRKSIQTMRLLSMLTSIAEKVTFQMQISGTTQQECQRLLEI